MDFLLRMLEESWPRLEGEVGSRGGGPVEIAPLLLLLLLLPLVLLYSLLLVLLFLLLLLDGMVTRILDRRRGRRGGPPGKHLGKRWHAGETHGLCYASPGDWVCLCALVLEIGNLEWQVTGEVMLWGSGQSAKHSFIWETGCLHGPSFLRKIVGASCRRLPLQL